MTTVHDILGQLRAASFSERDKGDRFERLATAFLRTDELYRDRYDQVWRWMDWPDRQGRADTGIDLVARDQATGELCAIQCKFYEAGHKIQKTDIDSFLAESGRHPFKQRMVIATTELGKHAAETIRDQQIPVETVDLDVLDRSRVDWSRFAWDRPEQLPLRPRKVLRPHQVAAVDGTLEGFEKSDRGKLIMACGTGKTFTALKLAEKLVPAGGLVLFLVPSISLLSQSLREWTAESEVELRSFAVCSDTKVGRDAEDLQVSDLAFPATTNAEKLAAQIRKPDGDSSVTVIFSTYQSIEVVSAAQDMGVPEFDLVICDEAHRTTGVTRGEEASHFLRVHDQTCIRARKRLYMTATPRIYAEASKAKAKEADVEVFSMDGLQTFGPEFHRLSFSKAVEAGILSDYKVIVLAVDQKHVVQTLGNKIHDPNDALTPDDAAKIIGCWNGLAKRFSDDADDRNIDPNPMRRAVAFANSIKNSKHVVEMFATTVEEYRRSLPDRGESLLGVQAEHVDGGFNIVNRNARLAWLKERHEENICRILSNARCLTEGVDVPALDAVIFLNPRDSQVDVVQAVGRVMRRAEGKKYGYVILPIVISPDETPEEALRKNVGYRVVWQVLNALRAHDDRFNDIVNKLELNKSKPTQFQIVGVGGGSDEREDSDEKAKEKGEQLMLDLVRIEHWREAIYAKIVEKCGQRRYWENWAKDVAQIAARHNEHIKLILDSDDPAPRRAFTTFLKGLKKNINDSIDETAAIEMLSQHLVTKPVFDALFENYQFSSQNPVSRSMEKVLTVLERHALWKETESLDDFYESVRRRASGIDNVEGKQRIIIELYDKFFRTAFPKMADRLGIVYTPVEIVDFILHSVEHVLKTEFNASLSDNGVHILDPFTGTGTFLVRLLQSGLIKPKDLLRKYRYELHANEIVLLAYYIAAVNIEEAYHRLAQEESYAPFKGILLTDTFEMGRRDPKAPKDDLFEDALPENSAGIARQNRKDIRVIVGNPPYSKGQESANDDNQNLDYPKLDARISETYAAESTAINKNSLYASEIRALRWASDRIGNSGVLAFVTNGSFIDGNTADGIRVSLAREFSRIYVFNLRGNARTQGEQRRKEKGNVFEGGSRNTIAIVVLVKNPTHVGVCKLLYHDIGDYLDRGQKLRTVSGFKCVEDVPWQHVNANEVGDWINQRNQAFGRFLQLNENGDSIFSFRSRGVETSRDGWVYNFSRSALSANVQRTLAFYNTQVAAYGEICRDAGKTAEKKAQELIDNNPKEIKWSSGLIADLVRVRYATFSESKIAISLYRPFCKSWLYYDRQFNHRFKENFFPSAYHENVAIMVKQRSIGDGQFALVVERIADLQVDGGAQCFPLYRYDPVPSEASLTDDLLSADASISPAGDFIRRDAITDWALNKFQGNYGPSITKEDIFYYVYGILHSPQYRERFANDLKKMLPRIPEVGSASDFLAFSQAGRGLAHWHLNYETIDPWPLEEQHSGSPDADPAAFYKVEKMRFGKGGNGKPDKTRIIYNPHVTVSGIPLEAYDYVVNGRPAIEWIIDRYRITTDKDSGIVNDPNLWSEDPRYIVDLLKRVVRVSIETNRIVAGLPELSLPS